jgi:single-stranded-DNA-specific exonuclease
MAHESAQFAAENNLDLIITDHHSLGNSLPKAHAVLNPKRQPDDAPLANICGAAVAFQLCTALNQSSNDLALVAIATIADVMPLQGENRLLTHRGLQEIQNGMQPGIQALLRKTKIQSRQVRAEDIAFQIAPRINASGRLGSGGSALELLLTDDPEEADYLASELNTINENRKALERDITRSALEQLERCQSDSKRTIVLADNTWHPGVIGIVASKLQHQFQKPVTMIAIDENGIGRGSARSNNDFSLIEAFQNCSRLFTKFGGHRNAAGMTIEEANIPDFQEALEEEARKQSTPEHPTKSVTINAVLAFSTINAELLSDIDQLEPLGHANPSPVFATFGVKPAQGSLRTLKGGHLQCSFEHDNQTFRAIGFNMAEKIDLNNLPRKVDIAYVPKFNHWQGNTTIQLQLIDIKDSKDHHIKHNKA